MSEPQPPPPAPPAPRRPRWKDPFVLAFVVGAVVLTALPFLQRRFLKAPAPVMTLPPWTLTALPDGGELSSRDFQGKVVLLMLARGPCDADCREHQAAFGRGLQHTDDLGDLVQLVSVALPGAEEALAPLAVPGSRWHLARGPAAGGLVASLREGWRRWVGTDAGATDEDFARLPAVALIDQDGALRGFWHDDPAGRGNALNGARLLARHGPRP